MNNKNRLFRVTSLLLVLCFISTAMISGTFAKYTSEYSGADTALVARWSFTGTFDGNPFAANLPIWDHAYTQNIYEKNGDDYLIAPGIQGSFGVQFSYDADVDADLTFKFVKSGHASGTVPIQYSLDGFALGGNVYYDLDELSAAIIDTATTDSSATIEPKLDEDEDPIGGEYVVTDTATAADGEASPGPISIDQTVSWKWPYDVSVHNALTAADAGVAADRTTANFPGTGEAIMFGYPEVDTGLKEWTDADDTLIGNSSANALTRDDYVLTLTIAATQKAPVAAAVVPLTNVAITGTTTVGHTLTAGLTPATAIATYQWQISDAEAGLYNNIVGATSKTYALIAADQGKYIKVIATGMLPEYTGEVTSNSTAQIAAAE